MSQCVAICRNVPCFTSCRERRGDRGVIYARYLAFLLTSKCRRRSLCLIKIALPCLLDVSAFYGDPKVCAPARAPVVILVTKKINFVRHRILLQRGQFRDPQAGPIERDQGLRRLSAPSGVRSEFAKKKMFKKKNQVLHYFLCQIEISPAIFPGAFSLTFPHGETFTRFPNGTGTRLLWKKNAAQISQLKTTTPGPFCKSFEKRKKKTQRPYPRRRQVPQLRVQPSQEVQRRGDVRRRRWRAAGAREGRLSQRVGLPHPQ